MKPTLAFGLTLLSASAYAGTGWVTTSFPGGWESGVSVRPNGDDVVIAGSFDSPVQKIGIARYLPTGALDTGFGNSGRLEALIGQGSSAAALAIGGDRIVVGGVAIAANGCWKPLLLRYLTVGKIDTNFGKGGVLVTSFGGCGTVGFDGEILDVRIDATASHIIVAGSNTNAHAMIARYNWNGTFDTSFGGTGLIDLTLLAQNQGISSMSLTSIRVTSSAIVAVGTADQKVAVARLKTNGTLDPSFASGKIVVSPAYSEGSGDIAVWSQPLSDGSIVVVANSQVTSPTPVGTVILAHYESNGNLDTSYGGNGTGRVQYLLGADWLTAARGGHAVDSSGRLVVGATYTAGPDHDFCAIRFTATGALDPTFNVGKGFLRASITSSSPHLDDVAGATLDSEGRPVLLGVPDATGQSIAGSPGFGLARFTTAGAIDTSFGP